MVDGIRSSVDTKKADLAPEWYKAQAEGHGNTSVLASEIGRFALGDIIEVEQEWVRLVRADGLGTFLLYTKYNVKKVEESNGTQKD